MGTERYEIRIKPLEDGKEPENGWREYSDRKKRYQMRFEGDMNLVLMREIQKRFDADPTREYSLTAVFEVCD